jgi:Xaa-Pro dipeptidase
MGDLDYPVLVAENQIAGLHLEASDRIEGSEAWMVAVTALQKAPAIWVRHCSTSFGALAYAAMEERERAFALPAVQEALRTAGLDGWLFYDFRGLDPVARKVLGLSAARVGTRRWFYLVPANGEPRKLCHAIEPGMLDALPGSRRIYLSWQSLDEGLRAVLGSSKRVAMQYSPRNEVPYVSRVDAGTFELVRGAGVEVVSSADLVQLFDATLSPEQLASHRRAAAVLRRLVDEVFDRAASDVRSRKSVTERSLLEFLEKRLAEEKLVYDHAPIIAVNANAANPHFEVPAADSAPVQHGDLLLLDLWAKERERGSIYADITWTVVVGDRVPEKHAAVFQVVRDARDAAIAMARDHFHAGKPIQGCELDRVARSVIAGAGYADRFIHRTGHSIHEEGHGNGANLDDLDTHDTRLILPRTLFSVEPGIYLTGEFGIRSEVNVYHTGSDAEVTGPPHQTELRAILAS